MADKTPSPLGFSPADVPLRTGSAYPEPLRGPYMARLQHRLGDHAGLTHFGVNLLTLKPGVPSALRHWHTHEDEFVYVVSGTLTLITDAGPETLTAGMCAGFKAGASNGHYLVNQSDADAVYLVVGDRSPEDAGEYAEADLRAVPDGKGGRRFVHKNGDPY